MTWSTRRLNNEDVAAMRALNLLFAEAFDADPNYTDAPPEADYIQDTLARAEVIALVAEHAGAVVGGLVAYVLPKLEQRRSEIYIYDLAVADHMRRKGVASGLLNHVREIAAQEGASAVYVQADYEDDPAVALYTKEGTREEVLHFDLDLKD